MRTRRADSPRFNRLRERRQARDSWSDLEHDDDGWLGKLKPEFAADDDELGPDLRAPSSESPRPSVTKPAIAEDPLRRSSPLRLLAASQHGVASLPDAVVDPPLPRLDGLSTGIRRARVTSTDPDVPASQGAGTVERASAPVDAVSGELDQADVRAQTTKALQLSEEQIGHLLVGAKRTADATVTAAEQRAEQVLKDAEARAFDIVATAEATAAAILTKAEEASASKRSAAIAPPAPPLTDASLEVQATLNAFAESNARLSSEISSLIRALDDPGTIDTHPAKPPSDSLRRGQRPPEGP